MTINTKYKPQFLARAEKRKRAHRALVKESKNWIDKKLSLVDSIEDLRDYDKAARWSESLFESCNNEFTKRSRNWIEARTQLTHRLDKLNYENDLEIPIQPAPTPTRGPGRPKTFQAFKSRRTVQDSAYHFLQTLEDPCAMEGIAHKQYDVLPLVLFSAACFGGLLNDKALLALGRSLQAKTTGLKYAEHLDLCWLDFEFDPNKKANNAFDENGNPICLRRWLPDGRSMVLLLSYLSKHKTPSTSTFGSAESLMKRMREALSKFTGKGLPGNMTLRQFCSGASSVFEDQADISQHIVDLMTGSTDWVSCREPYFTMYIGGRFTSSTGIKTPQVNTADNKQDLQTLNPNIAREVNALKTLFKDAERTKANKDAAKREVLDGLQAIKDSGHSLNLRLLCEWLLHVFDRPKVRSEATLKRYFSAIAIPWLAEFEGIDLRTLTGEAFYEKYEIAIESKNAASGYVARCFDDFHRFLHRVHKYPGLPSELKLNYGTTTMVRARLISEHLFQTFLETLLVSDLSDYDKNQFYWAFVFCFRLGLRIGDVCGLSHEDFEVQDELAEINLSAELIPDSWIFVRNNKHSATKSRRPQQLPLHLMLTPAEYQGFKKWYDHRRSLARSTKDPLFGPENTSSVIWRSSDLSHLFSALMFNISGLHYSPHDCRHTTASRLHAIMEGLTPLDGGCYSAEHAEKLRAAIFTEDIDARDKLWHLRAVFNHADPDTTCLNYLHLCEWITYQKHVQGNQTIPTKALKSLFQGSRASYTANPNCKDGRIQVSALNSILLQYNRRLVEFIDTIPIDSQRFDPDLLTHRPEQRNKIALLRQILGAYEDGDSAYTISIRHQINESYVRRKIAEAEALASLVTRQNVSRLFSPKRLATHSFPVSPTPLHEAADQKWAGELIDGLRRNFKTNQTRITRILAYWLTQTNTSETTIRFHHPTDLIRFIDCLKATGAINESDVFVRVALPEGKAPASVLKEWSYFTPAHASNEVIKNQTAFPLGVAHFHLKTRQKPKLNAGKKFLDQNENLQSSAVRTSKILRWVFHMLAILMDLGSTLSDEVRDFDMSITNNQEDPHSPTPSPAKTTLR